VANNGPLLIPPPADNRSPRGRVSGGALLGYDRLVRPLRCKHLAGPGTFHVMRRVRKWQTGNCWRGDSTPRPTAVGKNPTGTRAREEAGYRCVGIRAGEGFAYGGIRLSAPCRADPSTRGRAR
jgi:hypothetical protein